LSAETPSLKKNILLSTLYQILLVVLPFITAPYVARVIGQEGSGIYDFTSANQTYFSMFAALGTASYGAREIARVRNDIHRRSVLFWEIELMTVVTSLISLSAWIIFIFMNAQYRVFYIALSMGIFSTMFDISWFFAGIEQFKYTVAKNAMFKLLGVALMFLLVHSREDLLLYVIIITGSTMLGNLSMWLYIGKFTEKVDLRSLRIRRHFKETLIYFIPSVATSVYTVLDRTLIGLLTEGKTENGYYHYATHIVNIMKALTFTSLNTVLGSRISYLYAEERFDEIRRRIDDSINYILFMGLGICFGLISVAGRFIPLYLGPGYERVIYMLSLMSPIVVIIGISNCLGSQYYTPSGRRRQSARFIIIGSIVNLCLNLLLIPRFEGYGAIVASLIAEGTITVLYLHFSGGYMTFRRIAVLGWRKLIAAVLMLAAIRAVDPLIHSDIAAIAVEVVMGACIYVAITILLRDDFLTRIILPNVTGRLRKKG